MRDKEVNISTVSMVAKALSELKDKMVFVGGAVVSLYADIESDEELRETFDIDLTSIEVINYSKYNLLLERLLMGSVIIVNPLVVSLFIFPKYKQKYAGTSYFKGYLWSIVSYLVYLVVMGFIIWIPSTMYTAW